jgi:hypothetical protein
VSAPSPKDLAGTPLRQGEFTITAEENRRMAEILGARPPDDGGAHPIYAYIATQRGIGTGVEELCALADFDMADGPMLGSTELEYAGVIRVDTPYRVEGEVVGLVRKEGRTLGVFDILTYRERLLTPDGQLVARATNTFILPRRSADAR